MPTALFKLALQKAIFYFLNYYTFKYLIHLLS